MIPSDTNISMLFLSGSGVHLIISESLFLTCITSSEMCRESLAAVFMRQPVPVYWCSICLTFHFSSLERPDHQFSLLGIPRGKYVGTDSAWIPVYPIHVHTSYINNKVLHVRSDLWIQGFQVWAPICQIICTTQLSTSDSRWGSF